MLTDETIYTTYASYALIGLFGFFGTRPTDRPTGEKATSYISAVLLTLWSPYLPIVSSCFLEAQNVSYEVFSLRFSVHPC